MNDPIVIDPEYAEAKVYYDFVNSKHQHVYLVKVSILDAGFHINSITVQPSPKDPRKLWVQAPRFNVKGTWVWPIQIEKAKAFWELVQRLALQAVADFSDVKDEVYIPTDYDMEHIDEVVGKGIDDYLNSQPP